MRVGHEGDGGKVVAVLRHAARAGEVPELALHLRREPVAGLEAERAAEGAGLAVRRAAAVAAVHAVGNLSDLTTLLSC